MERLERIERQLALLWEKVQHGDQKQDARHRDILGLYHTLKEQLHTETNKESLGLWVTTLLEQRLAPLRGELDQESALREKVKKWIKLRITKSEAVHGFNILCTIHVVSLQTQSEEEQKRHQESEAARLADLEHLLKVLAAKTEVCATD